MSAPAPEVGFDAKLVPVGDDVPLDPRSFVVSMGLGGPAAGTFTEVVVPLIEDEDGAPLPDDQQRRIASEVVRRVAVQLYGTAWAFTYGPGEYAETIARHELRRRERVLVESVEVWT